MLQRLALSIRRSAFALLLLGCVLVLAAATTVEFRRWYLRTHPPVAPAVVGAAEVRAVTLTRTSWSEIGMPPGVPSAHASALALLSGDRVEAFWWAGTRESAPDVKVYSSRWANGAWSAPREVASRASLGHALGFGIRRIGNPAAWTGRDGRIHLFVVATGLGGWAASRVVHLISSDDGESFQPRRVLPMSPLFNTSVLVRSGPVGLTDGGWWLPAYFELGNKYPLLMAFAEDGTPRWLTRIGDSRSTLQPTIAPLSELEAYAWMRDASDHRRVQHAITRDGGANWEDMPALDLKNHGSSLAALRLTQGGFLLLHNHVEGTTGDARNILRLSYSKDARSWEHLFDVVRGDAREEFSYPSMQQMGNELHVTYTHRRTAIAHHVYALTPRDPAR